MSDGHTCPRCGRWIRWDAPSGESGIYGSSDIPDLCEPCWIDEDAEIERQGTNDLPEVLAGYRRNMEQSK